MTGLATFFSYGFRPFFLFGFMYGALSMAAWLAWIGLHAMDAEVLNMTIAMAPHVWHAHEMIYGYTQAAIAGFLLTAVPNWTDTRPVHGELLAALVAAWLAGRLAIWFSAALPDLVVAVLDLAFTPFLLVLVTRALMKRFSKRNLVFVPVLVLLVLGNLLFHLERLNVSADAIATGHTLALNTVLLLIVIIGGRVTPAFTTNFLRNRGATNLPRSHAPVDMGAIFAVAAMLAFDIVEGYDLAVGIFALAGGLLSFMRLAGSQGWQARGEPIVWILHVGYAWLAAGLVLRGVANMSDWIVEATAIHALTVGAVGSMTLAVMTRAALGHTGRFIKAAPPVTAAYLLISAAAVVRVGVPVLAPEHFSGGMLVSGVLWVMAFGLVSWVFLPVLTQPRARPDGAGPAA